jgi:gamma-glutamylcyclotransferase (GGCT)/AIG2-like uncharacterized protein YtfP
MKAPGSGRKPVYVIAYGSNIPEGRIKARTPHAELLGTGTLKGYQLAFDKAGLDGSAKANVHRVRDGDQEVWVAVYQMSKAEFRELNRYEVGYEVKTESVELDGGTRVEANLYVAPQGEAPQEMLPYSWYVDHIRRGYEENGAPQHAIDWLDQLETKQDTNAQRDADERANRARPPPVPAKPVGETLSSRD